MLKSSASAALPVARRVQGIPSLQRKLTRLRENTAPKVMQAMEIAADRVVSMAKNLVPVNTGDLRDSIGWTWADAPKGSIKIASVQTGAMRLTIFAGNEKAFYARWIEFGTAPHAQGGKFAGTEHPGTTPQPFFFPSYRANKKEVVVGIRKAIRDAVREAVK